MRLLTVETLTDAGLVIAGKPKIVDTEGEILDIKTVSEDGNDVTLAGDAIAFRCYSDKFVIVRKNDETISGAYDDFCPRGSIIKITSEEDKRHFWTIVHNRALTAAIDYEIVNGKVLAIGAAIFIGKKGGLDEVLLLDNDPGIEEELEILIPKYAEYYKYLLNVA